MSIYDYKPYASLVGKQYFTQPGTASPWAMKAITKTSIEDGKYHEALDQLKDCVGGISLLNLKAVLHLRLHQPASAANLLRSHIWDLETFNLNPDVPIHIQLNFATALLMSGHVSGAREIIRASGDVDIEQAIELSADIDRWEKSLSVLRWLDWKLCGIEHIKGEFPTTISLLGRFDWELKRTTIPGDSQENHPNEGTHSHDLAC